MFLIYFIFLLLSEIFIVEYSNGHVYPHYAPLFPSLCYLLDWKRVYPHYLLLNLHVALCYPVCDFF